MSRFYRADELVIDLKSVSCVYGETVVVDGVSMKFSKAVAFDIRKQFCAYKSGVDQKAERFCIGLSHNFFMLAWVADLIGNRIKRREALKSIPVTETLVEIGAK